MNWSLQLSQFISKFVCKLIFDIRGTLEKILNHESIEKYPLSTRIINYILWVCILTIMFNFLYYDNLSISSKVFSSITIFACNLILFVCACLFVDILQTQRILGNSSKIYNIAIYIQTKLTMYSCILMLIVYYILA